MMKPPSPNGMDTEDKIITTIVVVYFLVSLITFGHSAANAPCHAQTTKDSGYICKVLSGFTSAALWPFYWSWEIFDKREGNKS